MLMQGCSWVLGPSLVCMYQNHLTALVSLCLLVFGRSGCTVAAAARSVQQVRLAAVQPCMADLYLPYVANDRVVFVSCTVCQCSTQQQQPQWLCYECCDKHHSLQCSSTASVILKCILQCWSC
ncbi:TPA: hypothetical protein ACH3X2_008475 [Trebouxia sp. C0005]